MNDPIRSRIRDDILYHYEEPGPDLTRRLLVAGMHRQPVRRSNIQVVALTAGLLLLAVGILVARGMHLLPLAQEATRSGGLRPPQAAYSIVDNRFISASTGWILIQMHTTSGPTVLLKTSDGGSHWVEQFRYSGQGGIDYIDFSKNGRDGHMAWLEGGNALVASGQPLPAPTPTVLKIYATHDGGAHWTVESTQPQNNPPKSSPQPAYFSGGAGFFLDGNREGWQVRVPSNGTLPILIMHSLDGGNTWAQVSALPAGSGDGSVYFYDSKNGWYVVGDSRAYAWDGSGRPLPFTPPAHQLYVTHDGGVSWTALTLPLPAVASQANMDTHLEQPVMFDARNGVLPVRLAAGPTSPSAQPNSFPSTSYVLKTSDGGNHWGDLTQISGTPEDGAVLFLSPSHWLTTSGGMLSETTDGGTTWSTHRVLADGLTLSLAQWDYASPGVIWSQVGAGSLIRSTDGGRTWEAVTPPIVR
jgi:photosystem II stability/assembly factor-like uncharacterized protein